MYEMYEKSKITIHPPLESEHLAYLMQFQYIRHVKRDVRLLEKLRDPLRVAAGLPLGEEGAYYVACGKFPTKGKDPSVLDHNEPPKYQPHVWCVWRPNGSGEKMIWSSGRPDRYSYEDEWLVYLIKHFFSPWGYELRGKLIDRILSERESETDETELTSEEIVRTMLSSLSIDEVLASYTTEEILSNCTKEQILSSLKLDDILSIYSIDDILAAMKAEDIEAYLREIRQKERRAG